MEEPVILIFKDKNHLASGFSEHFLKLMRFNRETFNVALSGGSTPRIWFKDIVKNHAEHIDWSRVHVYWGDERCVPPDDEDSNYGMAKKYLLDHVSIPQTNIHRIMGELNPEEAARLYTNELKANLSTEAVPVFDLIILGMGGDGHTASIFPHEINLWDSNEFCVVATHPSTGKHRISLTGKVINNAISVAFLVTGKNKAEMINNIFNRRSGPSKYPARLVNPEYGQLFWFLDTEAASHLKHDQ